MPPPLKQDRFGFGEKIIVEHLQVEDPRNGSSGTEQVVVILRGKEERASSANGSSGLSAQTLLFQMIQQSEPCVGRHLNAPMMSNEHHRTGQIQLPIGRVVADSL